MELSDDDLKEVLWRYFRSPAFRPLQLEAIREIIERRDVLVVLPTGGGKSLVYQLPPLAVPHGFSVVISPLISLAQDQVHACAENGICAEVWNSETGVMERESIEQEIVDEETSLKLLYTTPESILTGKLTDLLKVAYDNGCLVCVAVDEAHCISSWGHDFRLSYTKLQTIRDLFESVPFVALTATCTLKVQEVIIQKLNLHSPKVIKSSFNRPNIKYQIKYKELIEDGNDEDNLKDLEEFISKREGEHGIIYARRRETCDWIASALCDAGVDVGCYHAGKSTETRRQTLQLWLEGSLDVMVATTAFGMGIDKANVRWVVHWNVASSLEGFYQESGRAGRDGLPCLSLVYLSQRDLREIQRLEKGVRIGAIHEVARHCLRIQCRRTSLLTYFNEARTAGCSIDDGEELCDVCEAPEEVSLQLDRLHDYIPHDFAPTRKRCVVSAGNGVSSVKLENKISTAEALCSAVKRPKKEPKRVVRRGFVCPRRKEKKT